MRPRARVSPKALAALKEDHLVLKSELVVMWSAEYSELPVLIQAQALRAQ